MAGGSLIPFDEGASPQAQKGLRRLAADDHNDLGRQQSCEIADSRAASVQQADALLNRLAARLACADRRERASTRRASVALRTNIRELKADSTVISYADGVGRVSHRGRLVSDELCHVRVMSFG